MKPMIKKIFYSDSDDYLYVNVDSLNSCEKYLVLVEKSLYGEKEIVVYKNDVDKLIKALEEIKVNYF